MNGKYDRYDGRGKKKVKPLDFISGGFKADDALVAQSNNYQPETKESEAKISKGNSEDVVIIEPQVERPTASGSGSKVRQEGNPEGCKENYAAWEKHEKGIGSKLLKKMGHEEGKGLGKSGQGIPLPIEAFQRLGRGTIGSYGSETKEIHTQAENKYKNKPWLRDIDMNKERERGNNKHDHKNKPWMKFKMRQIEKSRNKRFQNDHHHNHYVDVRDRHSRDTNSKEINLKRPICRDKHVDMFSDAPKNKPDVRHIPLPGTEIVIDEDDSDQQGETIVDQIMNSAKKNKRRRLAMEESMVKMAEEHERLVQECEKDDLHVSTVNRLNEKINLITDRCFMHSAMSANDVTIIEAPTTSSSSQSMSDILENCVSLMEELQKKNQKSSNDSLQDTILFLKPTISDIFKDWNPLQNHDHGFEFMSELKYTFITLTDKIGSEKVENFENLLSEHIIPKLRDAINAWNIEEPKLMLDLLGLWVPLMERRVVNQLYSMIFNMKMRKGLKNIDNSSQALRAVIIPWVPILGRRLRTLPHHIVQKIGWFGDFEVVEVLSDEEFS